MRAWEMVDYSQADNTVRDSLVDLLRNGDTNQSLHMCMYMGQLLYKHGSEMIDSFTVRQRSARSVRCLAI